MQWSICILLVAITSVLVGVEALPPGVVVPTDSHCYAQNASCTACTSYANESCIWTLTSWPPIQCWPAIYDTALGHWKPNTTAYIVLANATAPNPAPPMWSPVMDQFKCGWLSGVMECESSCSARVEDGNNQRNNGALMVRYSRNELNVPSTYNVSNWTPENWNSLGFNFYEVSMDGGSGDVSIGPPTCNIQMSYGTKPIGVATANASISSTSFMLMFDSYFFYSTTDYPLGWKPTTGVDDPTFHTLMNLTIQGNASVIRNGTVVNAVTLLPQHYNGTANQFNITCYWSNVPFYYDALHYIEPYTTKCDIQMANLTYPAGTDAVGLRVVAMSSLEEHTLNQHEGDDDSGTKTQSHTSLGAGTFTWDPTVYLNGNVSRTAVVRGNGPLACGTFDWLTADVTDYLLAHVNINPDNILCNYFSFETASQAKFMWDPEVGLDPNATDTTPTTPTTTPYNDSVDIAVVVAIPLAIVGSAFLCATLWWLACDRPCLSSSPQPSHRVVGQRPERSRHSRRSRTAVDNEEDDENAIL